MVSTCMGKPISAPTNLRSSQVLSLKEFQCRSDWYWPFLILSRKILNLSKNQNISSTAARQDRHKTLWKESINGENTEHRTLHSPFFCQALAECGCMRQRTSQTPRCCRCGRGRNPSPARQVRQTWHHVPAQHKWNKICVDPNKGVNACVFCPINSAF